jgi:hypothetical protein
MQVYYSRRDPLNHNNRTLEGIKFCCGTMAQKTLNTGVEVRASYQSLPHSTSDQWVTVDILGSAIAVCPFCGAKIVINIEAK